MGVEMNLQVLNPALDGG